MIDLKFKRVSKRYRINQEAEGGVESGTLLGKLQNLRRRPRDFWALRDVSFDVERGEALGIIGHNGAGKSTILKLLSNITAPTSGEITINGRLSALIEVGSGFHPDLTGRENIYLNGSILGMTRREISKKLDRIVDFAGVQEFIDTPVKRYSSGMYLRLGFSIAAHLDPDILLLDEVLAVGDATFQAKCLERITKLKQAGTTVVFISHDLNAVERLCDRVLLMRRGEVAASGSPHDIIAQYKLAATDAEEDARMGLVAEWNWDNVEAPSSEAARLRRVRVRTTDGQTVSTVDVRDPVGIEVTYDVLQPDHLLVPNYHFFNEERLNIFILQEVGEEWHRRPRPVGTYVSTAWVPGNFLSEGRLTVDVYVSSHIPAAAVHDMERNAVVFRVTDSLGAGSARGDYTGPMPGMVRPLVDWTTQYFADDVFERRVEVANTV